jgi:hypothetical protein
VFSVVKRANYKSLRAFIEFLISRYSYFKKNILADHFCNQKRINFGKLSYSPDLQYYLLLQHGMFHELPD